MLDRDPSPVSNSLSLILATLSHKGRGERKKSYTPAVVTPPSTTIVCPVMKLEASEPR